MFFLDHFGRRKRYSNTYKYDIDKYYKLKIFDLFKKISKHNTCSQDLTNIHKILKNTI